MEEKYHLQYHLKPPIFLAGKSMGPKKKIKANKLGVM